MFLIGHNLDVPEKVYLTKHVVAVRSGRIEHWVATVAGRSIFHSERMMGLLYDTVASSDYTERLLIRFEPKLADSDEESVP